MVQLPIIERAVRKMRTARRMLSEAAQVTQQLSELRNKIASLNRALTECSTRAVRPASMYLGDHIAIAKTTRGQRIFVDSRDIGLGIHLLTEGTWESWIADRFEQTLRPGATVIEVGANVGFYTLLGASLIGPTGRYYAFEANPHIARLLGWSVDINGLRDRVTIINKAAYSDRRTIDFHVLERYPGSSSIHAFSSELLEQVQDQVQVVQVEAVPLDELYADDSFTVDLIKIDAEGSEPHVFRGMERLLRRSKDVKIICEFDPGMISAAEDPRQFVEFLQGFGFRFWRIENPTGDLSSISTDRLLASQHIEVFISR